MAVHNGAHLVLKLGDAVLTAAGNSLVAAGHDGLQTILQVQRIQSHQGDDGGAVRVGDNVTGVVESGLAVDFRHYQRHIGVLTESGGVVHHHATGSTGDGGKLAGNIATGSKERNVHIAEGISRQLLHREHLTTECNLFTGRTMRGQKFQRGQREIAGLKAGKNLDAHRTGGAHDSDSGIIHVHEWLIYRMIHVPVARA